jgi:hypothetical protein
MPYFEVNRDGVNAVLMSPKLTPEDREFIHSRVKPFANTSVYVRVVDGARIRELLGVPASIEITRVDVGRPREIA